MISAYEDGYRNALGTMGMQKYANPIARWLVQKAPGFLHSVRTQTIGQPIKAYQQLRAGKLFSKGGLGRSGLEAHGFWPKLLVYGIPAGMAAYTMAGDDPDKYEQVGGLAAGTLLGGAAMGPLGMLGMMGGFQAGDVLGRHAGGAVRHLVTGEPSQAKGPAPAPLHRPPHPAQYGQALGMMGGAGGF